ncbi:MAG: hypothetical protein RL660_853 [Bacteroidota bacterium]|jgi:Zn-dependent metalloprotease
MSNFPNSFYKAVVACACLILVTINHVFAQNTVQYFCSGSNEFIASNFHIVHTQGWLSTKPGTTIALTNFAPNHKADFGLGVDDAFVLKQSYVDNANYFTTDAALVHEKWQQTYKGLEVQYAEMVCHGKNDNIVRLNAKLVSGLSLAVTPIVNSSTALSNALASFPSGTLFLWQDSVLINELDSSEDNLALYSAPTPQLLIAKNSSSDDYSANEFRLAYKVLVLATTAAKTIYVDAITGIIFKTEDVAKHGTSNLNHSYGANKYVDTEWRGGIWSHHILRTDDIVNRKIWTKKARHQNNGALKPFGGNNLNQFVDPDDVWGSTQQDVVTTHWCVTQAWDYFKTTHNRDGWDNAGQQTKVQALVTDPTWPGAQYWGPWSEIRVGSYQGIYLDGIDILGHEFAHGVVEKTANLNPTGVAGALNESFCDIFGREVEKFALGGTQIDWSCGEDCILLRKINHPTSSLPFACTGSGQANAFNGTNWITPGSCQSGNDDIYINAGVQSYWYYLLSEGSAGAPDGTFANRSVTGIGSDKASRIAYTALLNLTQNATYVDAWQASLAASAQLFGACSQEHISNINAWACVNLGTPYQPLTVTQPPVILYWSMWGYTLSSPITITASGDNGPYNWQYNGLWSTSTFGNNSENFQITNLNGNYQTSTIQATSQCATASVTLRFVDLSKVVVHGGNTSTTGPGGGSLRLFPNPARNQISLTADYIDLQSSNPIEVVIYESDGQVQISTDYFGNLPDSLDISSLSVGTYYVLVRQGYNYQVVQFVKQ